jgi:lipoyl(octanoyl) transferase
VGEPLASAWLGRIGYAAAAEQQESLRRRVLDGDISAETVLMLEHDPVITLGRAAQPSHVLASPELLAERGVTLVRSTRGGDVTWHGPGQLVVYPVMRLQHGVLKHIEALAEAVVAVAAAHGVEARFRRDCPGVWVGERKLAAFGVHVHRRVAIHGVAMNVAPDLRAFDLIVPCGLQNTAATSLAAETGKSVQVTDTLGLFVEAFGRAIGRPIRPLHSGAPPLE